MFERDTQPPPYALMLALLLSALLHIPLAMRFLPLLKFESAAPSGFPHLTVQLKSYAPVQLRARRQAPGEVLSESTPTATPDRLGTGPGLSTNTPSAAVSDGQNDSRQLPLNLSLPPMDFTAPSKPGTESGTVFSSQLRSRIADVRQSRPLSRAGSSLDLGTDASSYSGGQWETVLRVGDLCFRVIEANPLEALSNEQWFQVDCD